MKLWVSFGLLVVCLVTIQTNGQYEGMADNEFAEFEDFEVEEEEVASVETDSPIRDAVPEIIRDEDDGEEDMIVEVIT